MNQTIHIQYDTKSPTYRLLKSSLKNDTTLSLDEFLQKLGFDSMILEYLEYVEDMKQDIQKGNYSKTKGLWWNIK